MLLYSNGVFMKFILSLLISFQFISAPVIAAEVGEAKSFSSREYLKNALAEQAAKDFEATVRDAVQMAESGRTNTFMKEQLNTYSKADQETLKGWLAQSPVAEMKFKETSPGIWKGKLGKHIISFSLIDLHEEKIRIDNKTILMKGLTLAQLETKISDIIQPKTTFLNTIMNQVFIAEANAMVFLLVIVVALLAAAIWAASKLTKSSNENKSLDQIIAGDLQKCQDSKYNKSSYNDTFEKAVSIAEDEAGISIKGRFMKLLSNDEQDEQTCLQVFESSAIVSNQYSDSQKSAICKNVEQLAGCMNDFVQTHVKDETVRTPKEGYVKFLKKGDKDFKRFKASKQ
jgi:hypothetical protein